MMQCRLIAIWVLVTLCNSVCVNSQEQTELPPSSQRAHSDQKEKPPSENTASGSEQESTDSKDEDKAKTASFRSSDLEVLARSSEVVANANANIANAVQLLLLVIALATGIGTLLAIFLAPWLAKRNTQSAKDAIKQSITEEMSIRTAQLMISQSNEVAQEFSTLLSIHGQISSALMRDSIGALSTTLTDLEVPEQSSGTAGSELEKERQEFAEFRQNKIRQLNIRLSTGGKLAEKLLDLLVRRENGTTVPAHHEAVKYLVAEFDSIPKTIQSQVIRYIQTLKLAKYFGPRETEIWIKLLRVVDQHHQVTDDQ